MSTTVLESQEDRTLSPMTGYTRSHWVEIVTRLVQGVLPYVDRETGIPRIPTHPTGEKLASQLVAPGGVSETLDRTMLLMAVYMTATGRTEVDGYDGDIGDLYRRGILSALDQPQNTKRYPSLGNASTLAMLMRGDEFVEKLTDAGRGKLGEYLAQFVQRMNNESNLLFFRTMPVALLERLGVDYDRQPLETFFDRLLSMYRGDGWFIDGWNRGFDHYNFWAFQMYLNAMMTYEERWRDRYADRVAELTRAHEKTLPYYFGADGGLIPKGRSVNYRFAVLSGLAYSQLSGLSSLDPGLARRMASGCLKHFWDRGCLSDRGVLEIGFYGANSAIGEDYTDTGATYWASTGLAALALPEDHPFWTAEEKPAPADTPGVKRCCVRGGEMVLKADGDRGEARMHTLGEPFLHRDKWQAGSKYYQHAYSSTLGHALAGDLGPELSAGRTAISADGEQWAYRTWPRVINMTAGRASHAWDAWVSLEGLTGEVTTESIFLDAGEVHVFWHNDPQPRYLRIGGYAIRVAHGEDIVEQALDGATAVTSEAMWSVLQPLADAPAGEVTVERLHPREGFPHSHLHGGWSAWPVWTSAEPLEAGVKVAVFVDAARRAETPDPAVSAIGCADEPLASILAGE